MDVRRFLAFSDSISERWWDSLARVPAEALRANVDFSYFTPLGILTHVANVEMAWADVIAGEPPEWERHKPTEFTGLGAVRSFARQARARTHGLVASLDDAGLLRLCGPVDPTHAESRPARSHYTVEEILFHILTHEHLHRGEVLASLWHQNVEPPPSNYVDYGTKLR
ncbi:MAG TPA: DinB family protein [Candidatus Thermoplasmatota archaeon]|nr:DinB family protein [Candidatus Thermoplasmatota archaeon]